MFKLALFLALVAFAASTKTDQKTDSSLGLGYAHHWGVGYPYGYPDVYNPLHSRVGGRSLWNGAGVYPYGVDPIYNNVYNPLVDPIYNPYPHIW